MGREKQKKTTRRRWHERGENEYAGKGGEREKVFVIGIVRFLVA
jgi:hypothetical protein